MPGRFITDRQYEDYMKLRTQYTQNIAAGKPGAVQGGGAATGGGGQPGCSDG